MMLKSTGGLAGIALVGAALLGASGAPALATAAPHAAREVAWVRAAHLSPDTPKVDVYLTAFRGGSTKLWLSGVGYGDFSGYRRMAAGQYAVSMRPHGAAVTTAAALSWTVKLAAGKAYTAAAYGEHGQLHGVVFDDTLTGPPSGAGSVRIVQGSARAGTLNATADGRSVAAGTSYGAISGYTGVRAGTATVRVSSRQQRGLTATLQVPIASRSITSVVVLDGKHGGLVLRPHVDAAGAAAPPSGAVPAGAGGMATLPATGGGGTDILAGALGLTGLVLLCAGLLRRRRGAG